MLPLSKHKALSRIDAKVAQDLKSVTNSKRLSQKCLKNSQNGGDLGIHATSKNQQPSDFEIISGSEKEN